jgi:hypothetical protein
LLAHRRRRFDEARTNSERLLVALGAAPRTIAAYACVKVIILRVFTSQLGRSTHNCAACSR